MAARLRTGAASSAIAAVAIAVMSWLGLYGFYWTDYDNEAAPAFAALVEGHLDRFLLLLPAYGGSLELRAPFALLPGLFGGGELAVYRLVAVPCLLAGAALGVWLVARMRAGGHSRLSRAVALGLCVANPITLRALEIGHPEELLGGVLCVAAVMVATRGRPVWAGLLLGLAIANKQWALLAVGPVLLALPTLPGRPGRPRLQAALVAAVAAGAFFLPILAASSGGVRPAAVAVARAGAIFNPEQVFWFFGRPGHLAPHAPIVHRPGFRDPPSWLDGLAHPLIVALAAPLTLLTLLARSRPRPRARPRSQSRHGARPGGRPDDAMLLLALLLLLRCLLDPWDAVYYPLPFLLALLTWEATTRREPPVRALAATAAVWTIFVWLPDHASANLIAASTISLGLGTAALLAAALYRRADPRPRAQAADPTRPPAQSATTSSLGNWLSTSAPSSVTTTRSSILTPTRPGR